MAGTAEIVCHLDEARLVSLSQLARMGESIYRLDTLEVLSSPMRFVPASVLSSLRREAIAALKKEAQSKYEQYASLIEMAKSYDVENELKFFDKNLHEGYKIYNGGIF